VPALSVRRARRVLLAAFTGTALLTTQEAHMSRSRINALGALLATGDVAAA